MPEKQTFKQTLQMKRNYMGRACKLHFESAPLKIVQASRQYMYDDTGNEYLDCIGNISHVGHCHPHVTRAGQDQLGTLVASTGYLNEKSVEYAKRMIETLPEKLCVCFMVNSGSEANDLAVRLCRSYTGHHDVMVIDHAFHGNVSVIADLSPFKWQKLGMEKKDWVHVVPFPDTYRGKYREDSVNPGLLYANEARSIIQSAHEKKRKIAAFLCEPMMVTAGVVEYPPHFLSQTFRAVHEAGGLCIIDEVNTGLGRTGDHFWAFQSQDVVPDIVVVGKPLGNGFPMAMVITSKEIADNLSDYTNTFGGNPVACSIGLAVLDVIQNEKLQSSAKSVGKCLKDGLKAIAPNHPMIGDVRGRGMIVGIEIVTDKESRKPAPEAADLLSHKLKENKIIIANEGQDKNVMLITPPLCFTCDNARHIVQAIDTALAEIEKGASEAGLNQSSFGENRMDIPLNILSMPSTSGYSSEESDFDSDHPSKRARYEEVD
ncbi:5-phosphohydroxy-L-lysine phospho-lyase-like [Mytilus trossulus]|uniref:5-phosphohydroxy-L-lysine phospho-lyase-like n=1 Tax=Mytilus trossulus TaxID=6551 RepID=UPI003006642A